MNEKPTIGIITVVLGALLALIPTELFPVCSNLIETVNGNAVFMKCHWTAIAEIVVGILIVFNGVLLVGFKKVEARLALSIMLFLYGLTALLLTTVFIGMCKMPSMPCRMETTPAIIAASILIIATGAGSAISQHIIREKELDEAEKTEDNEASDYNVC